MQTAEEKRIDAMERTLKVLQTWASLDCKRCLGMPTMLIPSHVRDMCERALKREDDE